MYVARSASELITVGLVLLKVCSGREIHPTREGAERREEYGGGKRLATRKSTPDLNRKLKDHYCHDFYAAVDPIFNVEPTSNSSSLTPQETVYRPIRRDITKRDASCPEPCYKYRREPLETDRREVKNRV